MLEKKVLHQSVGMFKAGSSVGAERNSCFSGFGIAPELVY
jgi:hypothetical protein